jgi:hypothetical protein
MIIKKRDIPVKIKKLEALSRRLPRNIGEKKGRQYHL